MKVVIDTSSLLSLVRYYLPFDKDNKLKKLFQSKVESGEIVVLDKVAEECGYMTAVWWERQIDPSIVFGIPQVAVQDMRGNYLENQELKPDIEVYNDPASVLKGKDIQLEKAVEELLKQVAK